MLVLGIFYAKFGGHFNFVMVEIGSLDDYNLFYIMVKMGDSDIDLGVTLDYFYNTNSG